MKDIHVELVNKFNDATKDIIREYIAEKGLDIADIVYCSVFSAEEVGLAIKRKLKHADR